MTDIRVSGYDDLGGDAVLSSKQKDRVLKELAGETSAVLYLEDWLREKKSLDALEGVAGLFAGRVAAESAKAYLFTQAPTGTNVDDGRDDTAWVPKSASRLYRPPKSDDVDLRDNPQAGLADFQEPTDANPDP